jgi:hypothetical protein
MIEYCQIELTQGQVARVSPEDFEELSRYTWHAKWNSCSKIFYAARRTPRDADGKQKSVMMHRHVLGVPIGFHVDHINGVGLDNRRENLRAATSYQNAQNRKRRSNNTSGFKGVYRDTRGGSWSASIGVRGARIYLGSYETAEVAYAAYCSAAKEMHGEFARVA